MKSAILLLALVAGASALDLSTSKNRVVTKVVTLLKDMTNQLEKEADDDEEVYEQMACWCEVNDREKTKSIADGEDRSVQLTAAIEEGASNSARLNVEIKATEADIASNNQALEK